MIKFQKIKDYKKKEYLIKMLKENKCMTKYQKEKNKLIKNDKND